MISGRPSDQVRELVGVEDVAVVGTHGLEDEPPMAAEILAEIEAAAAAVGAWVEPKGAAAAVHFRGLEDPEAARGGVGGIARGHRRAARPGDLAGQAHPRADAGRGVLARGAPSSASHVSASSARCPVRRRRCGRPGCVRGAPTTPSETVSGRAAWSREAAETPHEVEAAAT